ncbi:MAG: hypothetical protein SWK76_09645 [Actinomycetota bacterium]|nr:hypothetical protein [Actinomycetota bacterium]
MEKRQFSKAALAVVVPLALFIILDLIVAIYHLSTEGRDSGIAEIALAVFLAALVIVAMRPAGKGRRTRFRRDLRLRAVILIVLAAAFTLFLAIYHLTYEGPRSGVIELSMTALLLALAFSLYRLESR